MKHEIFMGHLGYHFYFGSFTSSPYPSRELAEEEFKAWANPQNPEYKKALEEAQK